MYHTVQTISIDTNIVKKLAMKNRHEKTGNKRKSLVFHRTGCSVYALAELMILRNA